MSYSRMLASDSLTIIYRPEQREKIGSVLATLLLSQIAFRWHKYGEFYKFKAPCKHKLYVEGDSWTEEMGFGLKEFSNAEKVLIEKGLISKRITIDRLTFYTLHQDKVDELLRGIYESDETAVTAKVDAEREDGKCRKGIPVNAERAFCSYTKKTTKKTTKTCEEESEVSSKDKEISAKAQRESELTETITKIFNYWKTIMGKSRAVLTDSRQKKIKALLKKMEAKDICLAIKGCSLSEYHMKGGYNDFSTIFKSDDSIDRHIDLAISAKSPAHQGKPASTGDFKAISDRMSNLFGNNQQPINVEVVS